MDWCVLDSFTYFGETNKVKPYVNELRIGVMTALIITTKPLDEPSLLDQAIIRTAGKILSKANKIAFFYSFAPTETWKEVAEFYKDHFDKDIKPETVKRYAADAATRIIKNADSAGELKKWLSQYPK